MSEDFEPHFSGLMWIDRGPANAYEAYNEAAFRHFLEIECRRAERSGRSLLLLLVALAPDHRAGSGIAPPTAARLFSALTQCVREVDLIGWHRSGSEIGAVLTQAAGASADGIERQIAARIAALLAESLPRSVAQRLTVRARPLHSNLGD